MKRRGKYYAYARTEEEEEEEKIIESYENIHHHRHPSTNPKNKYEVKVVPETCSRRQCQRNHSFVGWLLVEFTSIRLNFSIASIQTP